MRLFYHTAASFLERKRKLRQFPEKLKTIGKYNSCFSSFFVCVRVSMPAHGNARSRAMTSYVQFSVDRLQFLPDLCAAWAGLGSVFWSLINSATRTLSNLLPLTYHLPLLRGGFNLSFLKLVSHGRCAFTSVKAFFLSCGKFAFVSCVWLLNESSLLKGRMSATVVFFPRTGGTLEGLTVEINAAFWSCFLWDIHWADAPAVFLK